jgi:hypothetical protein
VLRFEEVGNNGADGVDTQLSIQILGQCFPGAFNTEFLEGISQKIIRLLETFPGKGVSVTEISSHADLLRSLAGIYESNAI